MAGRNLLFLRFFYLQSKNLDMIYYSQVFISLWNLKIWELLTFRTLDAKRIKRLTLDSWCHFWNKPQHSLCFWALLTKKCTYATLIKTQRPQSTHMHSVLLGDFKTWLFSSCPHPHPPSYTITFHLGIIYGSYWHTIQINHSAASQTSTTKITLQNRSHKDSTASGREGSLRTTSTLCRTACS